MFKVDNYYIHNDIYPSDKDHYCHITFCIIVLYYYRIYVVCMSYICRMYVVCTLFVVIVMTLFICPIIIYTIYVQGRLLLSYIINNQDKSLQSYLLLLYVQCSHYS